MSGLIRSHYDATSPGCAYRELFIESHTASAPLVSRGNTLKSTRFYFADAVVEHVIFKNDTDVATEFFTGRDPIFNELGSSLFFLVTTFFSARGAAWKKFRSK